MKPGDIVEHLVASDGRSDGRFGDLLKFNSSQQEALVKWHGSQRDHWIPVEELASVMRISTGTNFKKLQAYAKANHIKPKSRNRDGVIQAILHFELQRAARHLDAAQIERLNTVVSLFCSGDVPSLLKGHELLMSEYTQELGYILAEAISITPEGRLHFIEKAGRREHLKESNNRVFAALSSLRAAGDLDTVTDLDLQLHSFVWMHPYKGFARSTLRNLQPLEGLQQLQRLSLRNVLPEQVGPDLLAPLTSCVQLRELDLSKNEGLTDLSVLSGCTSLQKLNLSNCTNLVDLSPLTDLKALSELTLTGCTGLKNGEALGKLPHLTHVNLSGCSASLDTSGLTTCPNLTTIIAYNGPSALEKQDGVEGVGDAIKVSTLTALVGHEARYAEKTAPPTKNNRGSSNKRLDYTEHTTTLRQLHHLSQRVGGKLIHMYSGLPQRGEVLLRSGGRQKATGPQLILDDLALENMSITQNWRDVSTQIEINPFRFNEEWALMPFYTLQGKQLFTGLTLCFVDQEPQRPYSEWQHLIHSEGGLLTENWSDGAHIVVYSTSTPPLNLAAHVMVISEAALEKVAENAFQRIQHEGAIHALLIKICGWADSGVPSLELAVETSKSLDQAIRKVSHKGGETESASLSMKIKKSRKVCARLVSYLREGNIEKAEHALKVFQSQIN